MGKKAMVLSGTIETFGFFFQSFLAKCFVPFPLFASTVVSFLNFSMYLLEWAKGLLLVCHALSLRHVLC